MRFPILGAVAVAAAIPLGSLSGQSTPVATEILEAVSPLPDSLRPGATVLGFRDGALVTVREGTNPMICLADEPGDDRFHVACYHRDLAPFMARGRELRAQGVTGRAQVDSIRRAEITSGRLAFPRGASMLYSLSGPAGSFDPSTGMATNARGLYVVYLPYATEESTGISTTASRERPWLMSAGEPWAHLMIAR